MGKIKVKYVCCVYEMNLNIKKAKKEDVEEETQNDDNKKYVDDENVFCLKK